MLRRRTPVLAALAAVTIAPLASFSITSPGPAAAAAAEEPSARVWAPRKVVEYATGRKGRAWVYLNARLVAGDSPLELWSTRSSYSEPITTVWRSPDGDVTLPTGSMKNFNELNDLVRVTVEDLGTGKRRTMLKDVCLNNDGERVRPDAPATSPYPRYCFANPYSVGSVQGVQAGWATSLFSDGRPVRLERGKYDVTVKVTGPYARALDIPASDATRTVRVVVRRGDDGHDGHEHDRSGVDRAESLSPNAKPAAKAPTGPELAEVDGPTPNLRSLPAWGISMAENGNVLRFAATVWNAGDSPLVVDGFRVEGEDRMDAYQYFFDGNGTQTGYQRVGSFAFDRKKSHQHWHFRDFAKYTLLRADKTTAAVSKKEAFCLANTDSIDQTVPNADWNPENIDLSTACGNADSLSLREVLASGWGDTYAQFRAGQAFNLEGLPNGRYYIATIANPNHRLVESSVDDNVSFRKIFISGTPGHRKVRVPQVGIVKEPSEQW